MELADEIRLNPDLRSLYTSLISASDFELFGEPSMLCKEFTRKGLESAMAMIRDIYGPDAPVQTETASDEIGSVEEEGGSYFGLLHSFTHEPPLYLLTEDNQLALSVRTDIYDNSAALSLHAYRHVIGGLREACCRTNWEYPVLCFYSIIKDRDYCQGDFPDCIIKRKLRHLEVASDGCAFVCCRGDSAKMATFSTFKNRPARIRVVPFKIAKHVPYPQRP